METSHEIKAFTRNINGKEEVPSMRDEDILAILRRGEKIKCPDCGEAYITTDGSDASICPYFYCPNCVWYLYVDPHNPEIPWSSKSMDDKINLGSITSGMMEASFYRKGMTPEEWMKEYGYYMAHFQEWIDGTYQPLWKQAMNKSPLK